MGKQPRVETFYIFLAGERLNDNIIGLKFSETEMCMQK